jgi:hypothetical protein
MSLSAGIRPSRPATLKGKIVAVLPRKITGWAALPVSKRPVKVRLRINGLRDIVVTADKPRPQLKKKGIHPSGFCGFVAKLSLKDALRDGDTIRAILEETEEELENSPFLFRAG